jgi:hypothetical protein
MFGIYVKNSKILDKIRRDLVNNTSRSKEMDKQKTITNGQFTPVAAGHSAVPCRQH